MMTRASKNDGTLEPSSTVVGKNPAVRKGRKGFLPGQSGNPKGRPKGSRNKATQLREALTSKQINDITKACVDQAIAGDPTALRTGMTLLYAREQSAPVSFDLPEIASLDDIPYAINAVLRAVSEGTITPLEASTVINLINRQEKALSDRAARQQQAPGPITMENADYHREQLMAKFDEFSRKAKIQAKAKGDAAS
jgi:hypothetical protein